MVNVCLYVTFSSIINMNIIISTNLDKGLTKVLCGYDLGLGLLYGA